MQRREAARPNIIDVEIEECQRSRSTILVFCLIKLDFDKKMLLDEVFRHEFDPKKPA